MQKNKLYTILNHNDKKKIRNRATKSQECNNTPSNIDKHNS